MGIHFQRYSQLRRAIKLKKPIHYISLNQPEFNTLYDIESFMIINDKPIFNNFY